MSPEAINACCGQTDCSPADQDATSLVFQVKALGSVAARRLSQEGTGRVHSTFRHSVNLLCGDSLVALVDAPSALHPFAVRLTGGLPGLQVGQAFSLDGQAIRFAGGLCVTLSEVAPQRLLRPKVVLSHLKTVWLRRVGRRLVRRSELASLLEPCGHAALSLGGGDGPRFLRAFAAGDEAEAEALACGVGLLGLGQGLTPAFDDFFVGVAASLAFVPYREASRKNRIIAGLAKAACGRTTRVSREFLNCAAQGMFSQPVLAVLDALSAPGTAPAYRAMRRLTGLGHTSGADSLTGLLAGLASSHRLAGNPLH